MLKKTFDCEYCGESFIPKLKTQKLCSDECRMANHREYNRIRYSKKNNLFKINCYVCSNLFESTQKHSKYCSDKCRNIEYKKNSKYQKYKRTNTDCEICGTNFEKKQPNHKYCSIECQTHANNLSHIKHGRLLNVADKNQIYSDKIIKKHEIGKLIICIGCKKEFKKIYINQEYCSNDCRSELAIIKQKANYKPKKFEKDKVCKVCSKNFFSEYVNQIYCSKRCSDEGYKLNREEIKITLKKKKEEELFAFRSKNSKYYTLLNQLRFYKEHDFEEWFKNNYMIFGIKELIKINRWFPDVVARMNNNKILRIELELMAKNFVEHDHDPNLCDLIICFVKTSNQKTIKSVPVISIFDTTIEGSRGNTSYSEKNLRISDFTKNLIEKFNTNINSFIKEKKIIYPDENEVLYQISRIKDLD